MTALAIARLDLAAIRRSRWLWFCLLTYTLLGIVLVTASSRESIVLDFTGSTRVLLSFSHALVLVLPLIALTATAPVIQRARVSLNRRSCTLQDDRGASDESR
jgi:ABC-type transport system involved in multi-copper enzyme maturation permease subunit